MKLSNPKSHDNKIKKYKCGNINQNVDKVGHF